MNSDSISNDPDVRAAQQKADKEQREAEEAAAKAEAEQAEARAAVEGVAAAKARARAKRIEKMHAVVQQAGASRVFWLLVGLLVGGTSAHIYNQQLTKAEQVGRTWAAEKLNEYLESREAKTNATPPATSERRDATPTRSGETMTVRAELAPGEKLKAEASGTAATTTSSAPAPKADDKTAAAPAAQVKPPVEPVKPATSTEEPATLEKGRKLIEEKKYEEAIVVLTAVIKTNPKDVAAYLERGNAYQLKGEHKKAIDDAKKAGELLSSKK